MRVAPWIYVVNSGPDYADGNSATIYSRLVRCRIDTRSETTANSKSLPDDPCCKQVCNLPPINTAASATYDRDLRNRKGSGVSTHKKKRRGGLQSRAAGEDRSNLLA